MPRIGNKDSPAGTSQRRRARKGPLPLRLLRQFRVAEEDGSNPMRALSSSRVDRSPRDYRAAAAEFAEGFTGIAKTRRRRHIPAQIGSRRPAMDIQGLGYVGIRAKSLEDWTAFGTRFLGMQLIDRSGKTLALRMDDRKQRVVVSEDGGEGVAFFGWEVGDAAALDRLAGKLERAGVTVGPGARALADERRGKE